MTIKLREKNTLFLSGGEEYGIWNSGCLLTEPLSLLLKCVGKTGPTVSQQRDFPHTQGQNAMVQCKMEWKDVKAQCDQQEHMANTQHTQWGATYRKAWLAHLLWKQKEQRKYKKKKKLDMVRVKPLSSSRTLSREFHASWTHFTRQHRAKNSFPFGPALKTHLLFCFKE